MALNLSKLAEAQIYIKNEEPSYILAETLWNYSRQNPVHSPNKDK